MRHRVYGKKLGRNKNERTALFKSLVQELILHGTITTSESKAKAIKGLVDKIINLAKSNNTRRLLQAFLVNKDLQERLVKEIVPKLGSRTSGYTSVMRMGEREGDRTTLVKMSIIGSEELKPLEKQESRIKNLESSKKAVKTETKKVEKKPKRTVKSKTPRRTKKV